MGVASRPKPEYGTTFSFRSKSQFVFQAKQHILLGTPSHFGQRILLENTLKTFGRGFDFTQIHWPIHRRDSKGLKLRAKAFAASGGKNNGPLCHVGWRRRLSSKYRVKLDGTISMSVSEEKHKLCGDLPENMPMVLELPGLGDTGMLPATSKH